MDRDLGWGPRTRRDEDSWMEAESPTLESTLRQRGRQGIPSTKLGSPNLVATLLDLPSDSGQVPRRAGHFRTLGGLPILRMIADLGALGSRFSRAMSPGPHDLGLGLFKVRCASPWAHGPPPQAWCPGAARDERRPGRAPNRAPLRILTRNRRLELAGPSATGSTPQRIKGRQGPIVGRRPKLWLSRPEA